MPRECGAIRAAGRRCWMNGRRPEPTPEFDVRVRQAVEARQAGRRGVGVLELGMGPRPGAGWSRRIDRWRERSGSPTASAGFRAPPALPREPSRRRRRAGSRPGGELACPRPPANSHLEGGEHAPGPDPASTASAEDKEAQALEDYDMAANFDLLSELPKGESPGCELNTRIEPSARRGGYLHRCRDLLWTLLLSLFLLPAMILAQNGGGSGPNASSGSGSRAPCRWECSTAKAHAGRSVPAPARPSSRGAKTLHGE